MGIRISGQDACAVAGDDVETIRSGSRERALGVAMLTIALSAAVAWFLVEAGYGVVSSLLIVWLFGNLLFLGLVSLARLLAHRRSDAIPNGAANAGSR